MSRIEKIIPENAFQQACRQLIGAAELRRKCFCIWNDSSQYFGDIKLPVSIRSGETPSASTLSTSLSSSRNTSTQIRGCGAFQKHHLREPWCARLGQRPPCNWERYACKKKCRAHADVYAIHKRDNYLYRRKTIPLVSDQHLSPFDQSE